MVPILNSLPPVRMLEKPGAAPRRVAGWTRAECRLCMLKIVLTGVLVRPAAREDRARQHGESMNNQRQTSAADVHIDEPACLECSSPGRLRFREKRWPAGRVRLITFARTLSSAAQTSKVVYFCIF